MWGGGGGGGGGGEADDEFVILVVKMIHACVQLEVMHSASWPSSILLASSRIKPFSQG